MVVPILNVNCLIILKKHNFALLLNVSLSWSEKKKKFNFISKLTITTLMKTNLDWKFNYFFIFLFIECYFMLWFIRKRNRYVLKRTSFYFVNEYDYTC